MTKEQIQKLRELIGKNKMDAAIIYFPPEFQQRWNSLKSKKINGVLMHSEEAAIQNQLVIDMLSWLTEQEKRPNPYLEFYEAPFQFDTLSAEVLHKTHSGWTQAKSEVGRLQTLHKVWLPIGEDFAVRLFTIDSVEYNVIVGGIPVYSNGIIGVLDIWTKIPEYVDLLEGPYDSPYRFTLQKQGPVMRGASGQTIPANRQSNHVLISFRKEIHEATRGSARRLNLDDINAKVGLSQNVQEQKPQWMGNHGLNKQYGPEQKMIIEIIPFEV